MNNKKALILYQYNRFNNDLTYIKEYYNKEEIKKDFKIKDSSIYQYIIKDIEKINENTRMIENSFILIRG